MPPGKFRRMVRVPRRFQHAYGRHHVKICPRGTPSATLPPRTEPQACPCGPPADTAGAPQARRAALLLLLLLLLGRCRVTRRGVDEAVQLFDILGRGRREGRGRRGGGGGGGDVARVGG